MKSQDEVISEFLKRVRQATNYQKSPDWVKVLLIFKHTAMYYPQVIETLTERMEEFNG